jgi:DNA-binding PadR family transcriptional regulator
MKHQYPGEFEQMILLAVLRVGAEAWAVPVRLEIESRTGRSVARGALYTSMERLESKGLLRSRTGSPRAERGGRSRRYFEVTALGLRELREAQRAMARLRRGLESVLERR